MTFNNPNLYLEKKFQEQAADVLQKLLDEIYPFMP